MMTPQDRAVVPSREAEVASLGRALAVERRARYTNFKGKRLTFSQFMRQTADKLSKRFPLDHRWATIRSLFGQYPNFDVASRITAIRRTEELLFPAPPPVEAPVNPHAAEVIERKAAAMPAPPRDSDQPGEPVSRAAELVSRPAVKPPAPAPSSSIPSAAPEPARASDRGSASPPSSMTEENLAELKVQYVKGVGPKLAEMLERIGIYSVLDLLKHYPRHHLDFQNRLPIGQLRAGQEVTVFGTIRSVGAFQSKKGNISIVTAVITDGTGSLTLSKFFGGKANKFLLDRYKSQLPKGAQIMASGLVEHDKYRNQLQLKNAEIEIVGELGDAAEEASSLHTNRLVPVYPLTEGLPLRQLRSVMHNALTAYDGSIVDPLPVNLRAEQNLPGLRQALWDIHFPEDLESKDIARRRLAFDELFTIQLQLACRRHRLTAAETALELSVHEGGIISKFRECLPFTLTGAQERVFAEIAQDLRSNKPMQRLIQGDVGSGKTVVAAMSTLVAIDNGYQAAVMAPTEILAEQHFRQFQKWFTPLGLRCALFLGKQGAKERKIIQQDLLAGQVHVAIGTHALIQDDVEFARLGLIVIDEQHRFGVKQRARLKAKGLNPELLTMTATPIPRTLALTLHGDLDVSEIDELPPGRKPIETKVLTGARQKEKVIPFLKGQVEKGRQAYVVFPLIEESETLSAKAASAEFERLRKEHPDLRFGLMHGKLKPQEKEEVMDQFRQGHYDILVCTTVIEVGVDVPNATVMVIENADRFGLAQLHQLRGRVGRGGEQSYCFLIANSGSDTVRQRLGIMEQTNDGFVIAEKDLEMRGPGEFLGVRQSGLPEMFLADLINDAAILEEARNCALHIVRQDPTLDQHPELKPLVLGPSLTDTEDLLGSG